MQKPDLKQRTLEKIRASMHSSGLLKSNSVKELKSKSHQDSSFRSKERSVGDIQPVVLIKPCASCREPEETFAPIVWEE